MSCDDCRPTDVSHASTAYRRALWVVVLLNVGMGVAEMIGGFHADSQALKADALDFLGDGTITFVALLATGWSCRARAKVALLQGGFLAVLGVGVLATTGYRILVMAKPEGETMTAFGFAAFLVNMAAAAALLRHRSGDAGVTAVWLFSRNDALGNLAVIAAGALVYWTKSPIPDLIVAAVIAGLFLHSARLIFKKSARQMRNAAVANT